MFMSYKAEGLKWGDDIKMGVVIVNITSISVVSNTDGSKKVALCEDVCRVDDYHHQSVSEVGAALPLLLLMRA